MEYKKLRDLKPGDMFRRPAGTYRYVVSSLVDRSSDDIFCYNLDGASHGYSFHGDQDVALLLPFEEEQEPSQDDTFYMCYAEGGRSPAMKHTSVGGRQEAERIARVTGYKVFLLKAISCVQYTPPSNSAYCWTSLKK